MPRRGQGHARGLPGPPTHPLCAEGVERRPSEAPAVRLAVPIPVPPVRAPGEDREDDSGQREGGPKDDPFTTLEREDGGDEQQDQAHQTASIRLSEPRPFLLEAAVRNRSHQCQPRIMVMNH